MLRTQGVRLSISNIANYNSSLKARTIRNKMGVEINVKGLHWCTETCTFPSEINTWAIKSLWKKVRCSSGEMLQKSNRGLVRYPSIPEPTRVFIEVQSTLLTQATKFFNRWNYSLGTVVFTDKQKWIIALKTTQKLCQSPCSSNVLLLFWAAVFKKKCQNETKITFCTFSQNTGS